MRWTIRPLPAIWPSGERTPEDQRRPTPFRTSMERTMAQLERELLALGVGWEDVVVMEAGYREHEIRQDGQPRRDAHPRDPAVVISFGSRHGPLRYGCDTYSRHEANVRALALSLEALRAVDRHGVTKRGEQYAGWLALPAGPDPLTRREAMTVILKTAGLEFADHPDVAQSYLVNAWRIAAKKAHPDTGGNLEDWNRLQHAKEVLGL